MQKVTLFNDNLVPICLFLIGLYNTNITLYALRSNEKRLQFYDAIVLIFRIMSLSTGYKLWIMRY